MKNIFKFSALIAGVALLLTATSCANDVLDTNQFPDDAVTLASYGPNPVMRGGTLRFFGSNLEKVTEVSIPGVEPIKDIEVVASGKVAEIRVQVPVEGPEVGYVTLKAGSTVLTTRSELKYTEPIVFEGFEAKSVNYPGDVVTIKGDYMNLISKVIFAGGEEVAVEEGSTRKETKVVIPSNAVTGKIILSDGGAIEQLFYSEKDLVIGEPTVSANAAATLKAGASITVKGEYLNMINRVVFPTAEGTVDTPFEVSGDNKTISFTLPATAIDGQYTLVSFAEKSYKGGEVETVVPTELVPTSEPVKAGKTFTIAGKDLDLVVSLSFENATNAAFSYNNGKITVTVPETAKDGKVTLGLENGKTVETAITLVHPTITSVSPAELYAGDEPVVVEGTDLDLIVSAKIGAKDAVIAEKSETSLTLATEVTSVGGAVVLTLANGETLTSEESVVMKYHSKVILTSRPAGQHIGEEVVLKGSNMDLVETIYVGDAKVTKYALRTADEIRFLMPWAKVGSYELKFVLFDGDEEIQADPIEVLLERQFTTYYEGSEKLAWNEVKILSSDQIAALAIGQTLVINYTVMDPIPDGYTQIRMIGGGWSFNPEGSPIYQFDPVASGVKAGEDGVITITVDADLKSNYAGGLSLTGNGCIITKGEGISEISQEVTVFEGPCDMSWGDDGRFGLAYEYFKDLNPGAKLIFYIEHTHDWGQIQINDGWWNAGFNFAEIGGSYIKTDIIGTATRIELTLDDANLAIAKSNLGGYAGLVAGTKYASPSGQYSFVLQGSDMRILSIAVLQ